METGVPVASGFALIPCVFMLIVGLLSLASTAVWIWMLIDCAMKEPSEGNDKIIWILVIVFTGIIGALIYMFIRRPQRIQQYGA